MIQEFLRNIDALLITEPTNIRYLTGFVGLSPYEREAYALITPSTHYLFTHALYLEQTKKLALNRKLKKPTLLETIEISREEPLTKRLKEILSTLQSSTLKGLRLGFEEVNLSVAEFHKVRNELIGVVLVPTQDRIEEIRKIKHPEEVEWIIKAAKITDHCFETILGQLKLGVSETEIAWEIETFFHKNGAVSAFPPIVAFGENSSQPHYTPTFKGSTLKGHSLVLLDFGARVNGYCADMTRVVFAGKPTLEQQRVYKVVYKAQTEVVTYLKKSAIPTFIRGPLANGSATTKTNRLNSISSAALDRSARETIEKAGFPPYPHSLGHNVGLAIHEGPRLSIKKDEQLKPGMVFTIEPAVYLEGKFGIRIEDLILLKEDGIEILSKSPKKFTIITL